MPRLFAWFRRELVSTYHLGARAPQFFVSSRHNKQPVCRQSGKETEGWPIKTHLILIVQPTAAADRLGVYWLSAAQSLRSQAKKVPHKSVSWPQHPPLSPGTSPTPLTTCWWWQPTKQLSDWATALAVFGQLVRRVMKGLTGDQWCHAGLQIDTTLFSMVDTDRNIKSCKT